MKHIVCESLYFGAVLFLVFCFYYFTSSASGTPSKSQKSAKMQMIGRHFDRDCCYGPVSARRAELSHVVEFQPIRHFSPVKSLRVHACATMTLSSVINL